MVLLEAELNTHFLRIACRHHVAELFLKAACHDQFYESSKSPDVPFLSSLKKKWDERKQ